MNATTSRCSLYPLSHCAVQNTALFKALRRSKHCAVQSTALFKALRCPISAASLRPLRTAAKPTSMRAAIDVQPSALPVQLACTVVVDHRVAELLQPLGGRG